jgi:hypothetical protein
MTQFSIKTYRSLSLNEQHRFFNFCKAAAKETNKPASKNMWSDNWKNDPASLLYILENGNRFNGVKGEFFLLFDGDNIVGCSGIYISDFNDSIALAGVRTWIDFSYRNDFRSTSVKAYSKEFVIILDTNFTISDLTIKTDVTRPMNYCTTLWEYDGQCYSTTVDGNAVDIWILSFQDDSWSDADIYVIPHYRSDRENLSDSEYNDWKFFRK